MESKFNLNDKENSKSAAKAVDRKTRSGRWSTTQSYLFQSLLERYGINWKKIHEHLKLRSLSQIRSYAQKYFEKIDAKGVEKLKHRAKLIEAFQAFQKQERLKEAAIKTQDHQIKKVEAEIKQEESENLEGEAMVGKTDKKNEFDINLVKSQEIIEEQNPMIRQSDETPLFSENASYSSQYYQHYLMSLLYLYPNAHAQFKYPSMQYFY